MVNFQAQQEAARRRETIMGVLRAINRDAPSLSPAFQAKMPVGPENMGTSHRLLAQREAERVQAQDADRVKNMLASGEWAPAIEQAPSAGTQGLIEGIFAPDVAMGIDPESGDVVGDPKPVRNVMAEGPLFDPNRARKQVAQSLKRGGMGSSRTYISQALRNSERF